ncbi:MAG TPA: S8 family serine peptidase [Candidatus Limnocylindria bacterium]|nr:S8 family serine peptidase [Candidatus Limnocylindria bacterium]
MTLHGATSLASLSISACLPFASLVRAETYSPAPSDDFFPASVQNVAGQWYLENRDPLTGESLGADLNLRAAWPLTRGQGVVVALAGTGIQLTHPEFAISGTNHFHHNFFNTNSVNYGPVSRNGTGAHATSCAGLIAAADGNTIGMTGVAPDAQVASWVIFDSKLKFPSPQAMAAMYQYASESVWIQLHAWGASGNALEGPTAIEADGIAAAATQGHSGLGTVMVRIAGNRRGDAGNANDDGWANDPRAICVAGVRPEGRAASYSNPGACILVAAPGGDYDTGGLFTTDLMGFDGANILGFLPPYEYLSDFRFNSLGLIGTSGGASLVSGVAALILSENPTLGARDVQQILIFSSHHFDLTDGGLSTNAAGLRVSHNVGFGIPDAGEAVRLAHLWTPRPPASAVNVAASDVVDIPDDGLRVEVEGTDIPANLRSIHCLPGTGLQPDTALNFARLADIGLATNHVTQNLSGLGALIERGTNDFSAKLSLAAEAGATFAVVYNYTSGPTDSCPGGDQLCPLGGTDFSPIPGVFITHSDGVALRNLFASNPTARARLATTKATVRFTVNDQLSCEQVTVRLQTDHSLRGDLRILLTSPGGTSSVLQTYNSDVSAGPTDWTYMTTHAFFEEAAGVWTLDVIDEGGGETGSIQGASLTVFGVPIVDEDHDGMDDTWETAHFGNLGAGPLQSTDGDSWSNLREFIQGTDPQVNDQPFVASVGPWDADHIRVSWPNDSHQQARLDFGASPVALTGSTNVTSLGSEGVWISPRTNQTQFFRVTSPGKP